MINIFSPTPTSGGLIFWITLLLMVSPPAIFPAEGKAPKYKKQTVVDFEGALVEGKSRKPYSAYLTQQKEAAFSELHTWQPDLEKSLRDSQTRMDKTL
jgi:hypothetical protein